MRFAVYRYRQTSADRDEEHLAYFTTLDEARDFMRNIDRRNWDLIELMVVVESIDTSEGVKR